MLLLQLDQNSPGWLDFSPRLKVVIKGDDKDDEGCSSNIPAPRGCGHVTMWKLPVPSYFFKAAVVYLSRQQGVKLTLSDRRTRPLL